MRAMNVHGISYLNEMAQLQTHKKFAEGTQAKLIGVIYMFDKVKTRFSWRCCTYHHLYLLNAKMCILNTVFKTKMKALLTLTHRCLHKF